MKERIIPTIFGTFQVSPDTDPLMTRLLESGVYNQASDIALVSRFVNGDTIFADIGAHIGSFTVPIARIARVVHCFEPVPRTLEFLKNNIDLNQLSNVEIHPYGLGTRTAEYAVSICPTDGGSNSLLEEGAGRKVSVKKLDDVLERVDVIKIDVEGMEVGALQGGQRLLREYQPIIFSEVNYKQMRSHKSSPAQLENLLRDLGYDLYLPITNEILGKIRSLYTITFLMNPTIFFNPDKNAVFNILCVPRSRTIPFRRRPFLYTYAILVARMFVSFFRRYWYILSVRILGIKKTA